MTSPNPESIAARRTVALQLISQAGDVLQQGLSQDKHIRLKGIIDPVTQFDHQSEAVLVNGLERSFPGDAIRAEERGGARDGAWVWYVDPLDGTVNFAHGVPIFAVSVGLAFEGNPVFGAILDPMRAELFEASLGQGARLNGRPIHVSNATDLLSSLLVTGFRYDIQTNPDNNFREFAEFHLRARGVRRLGAAALDLAYVAAGRFDGYWELEMEAWDLAAGAVIVREAGGVVTRLDGSSDMLRAPLSLVASNGQIHTEILRVLAELRRPG
jgi:myo-inositol-1(or 4)-monophosphatase